MLKSFTVENFRSFREPTTVVLRPITLLLGKNSSGKSSLTRLIPLLQQSIDRRTASPILWTSDVVDFGDISNVINHSGEDGHVAIEFSVDAMDYYRYARLNSPYHYFSGENLRPFESINFRANLTSYDGRTRYYSTKITIEDTSLEIHWGDYTISQLIIDGKNVDNYWSGFNIFAETSTLFPTVSARRSPSATVSRNVESLAQYSVTGGLVYPGLVTALEYFINKKTGQAKRSAIRRSLYYTPPSNIRAYTATLENIVQSRLKNDDALYELSAAMLINDFPLIIAYVESRLRPFLEAAAYLGPARASGARFYRFQELSVDRIDARGENLPMYLSSLSEPQLASFNDIMAAACGFVVAVKRTPGHASIEIGRPGESRFENIADVGFGFSQFLPIVAQIHAAGSRSPQFLGDRYGRAAPSEFLMAVEQPELHLHPALQDSLADLFVAAIHNPAGRLNGRRFLIETHSEPLISRLSQLIVAGALKSPEVLMYFVEKDELTKNSTIRVGGFRDDGSIDNWPIGFFSGKS